MVILTQEILVLNCSHKQTELRDKLLLIKSDNLTIINIVENISTEFEVTKKIKLYTNTGLEVKDDSDLYYLIQGEERVIFFTKEKEIFENTNVLRLFHLQEKIGEVIMY
jgi:hypothetical protein